jgi:hypothetical protein
MEKALAATHLQNKTTQQLPGLYHCILYVPITPWQLKFNGIRTNEVIILAHDAHDNVMLGQISPQGQPNAALHSHNALQKLRPGQLTQSRITEAHFVPAKEPDVPHLPVQYLFAQLTS